jgi:hypothetical protein
MDMVSTRDMGQAVGPPTGYANRAEITGVAHSGSLTFTVTDKAVVNVGGAAGRIEYKTAVKGCTGSMIITVNGGYDAPVDPNIVIESSVGAFVGLFKYVKLFQNFSFWNSFLRFSGKTGLLTGFSKSLRLKPVPSNRRFAPCAFSAQSISFGTGSRV